MTKRTLWTLVLIVCLSLTGCAHITEFTKKLWGSSTEALEEARIDAERRIFQCKDLDCFDQVLQIAEEEELTVFIQDRKKSMIVLMGIPEVIDTTEIGVFFLGLGETETKVEISSLSQNAKNKASDLIFMRLAESFKEIR
ncbi:MAG: hypothetical protein ABIJ41_00245 [Candidatus Omnitrophota bacterium]